MHTNGRQSGTVRSTGEILRRRKGLLALLVTAATAVVVWTAVETFFVDRWEREEQAKHAAREAQGAPSGSAQAARAGRNGPDGGAESLV